MKKLFCMTAILVLMAFSASTAMAQDVPDAWVKGLWLKATGLPKDADFEDMSQDDTEPYFIYSFGEAEEGSAVAISIGRYEQNEMAEKIAALDKTTLMNFALSEELTEKVNEIDLRFSESEKYSEKFTYPSQIATYNDVVMGQAYTLVFIQTDSYMFVVTVRIPLQDKRYSAKDVEKWLMGLELVD